MNDGLQEDIDEAYEFAKLAAQVSSDYFMGGFADERHIKFNVDHLSNSILVEVGHFPGEYGPTGHSEIILPPDDKKRSDDVKESIANLILTDSFLRIEEAVLMMYSSKNLNWKNFLEIGTGWAQMSSIIAGGISMRCDRSECNLITVDYSDSFKNKSGPDELESNLRQKNVMSIMSNLSYGDFWSNTDIGSCEYFDRNKEPLDFVFIDGDHSYSQTISDWNNVSNLLSKDGIIIIHDLKTRTQGLSYPNVALKAFEEISHKEWIKYRLPTTHKIGLLHRREASDETYDWVTSTFNNMSKLYSSDKYCQYIYLDDFITPDNLQRNAWHNIINGITGLI